MTFYHFKLFIAGDSPRSRQALADFQAICESTIPGCYDIRIIDVLDHPELAAESDVLATPTAIKERPGEITRVVGDLSNPDLVLSGLGIPDHNPTPSVD